MGDRMTQEDAMNMSNEQAVQILKPFRDMMIDQHGCPISDAVFALDRAIEALSVQPEWNNHTVACLLAELFDDKCACNYNGIDEWLPEKCEVIDSCPNPVGVACWEQYLKHRAERRTG